MWRARGRGRCELGGGISRRLVGKGFVLFAGEVGNWSERWVVSRREEAMGSWCSKSIGKRERQCLLQVVVAMA